MEDEKDFDAYGSIEYVKDKRRKKRERDLEIKKQKRSRKKHSIRSFNYRDYDDQDDE